MTARALFVIVVALVARSARADDSDDPYEDWEIAIAPDPYASSFRPGYFTHRCFDELMDPVVTPLRDAAIDAQRSACGRNVLSIHVPISALVDTPGFHGEIDGALELGVRHRLRHRYELTASVRALRYGFVQNAVNKATELQAGPLVLGAAYIRQWGVSAFALAGVVEVPFTRTNLDTAHLTGSLTAIVTNRLTQRATLHTRLGFVGGRAWSLGGSTGRMAFRAGADVVRRVGERWSLDLGAELQAGWYDGFDGVTLRLGTQRRLGERYRGMLGVGLPVGGDERTDVVVDIGIVRDLD